MPLVDQFDQAHPDATPGTPIPTDPITPDVSHVATNARAVFSP